MIAMRMGMLMLIGLGLAGPIPAQPAAGQPAGKMYTNKQAFRLPFNLSEADRARLREVQLYVKCGSEPWACKETAPPAQTHFGFRATQDGDYAFNIVTVDKSGRAAPADVTRETPALVVVVDTQPPEVALSAPVPGSGKDDGIRCTVKDANPDPTTLRLEYQTTDRGWQPLELLGDKADLFRSPAGSAWTGVVRVSVSDRAGNTTVREVNPSAPVTASSSEGPELELPGRDAGAAFSRAPSLPAPLPPLRGQPLTPRVESRSEKQPLPIDADPAVRQASGTALSRMMVAGTTALLEYRIDQVGPSGVSKVEVWLTTDEGKTWQRLCEDADRRSPVEFRLPGEGTYGVSVVVVNGVGVGDPPPRAGTAPDCWIEVDSTRPSAQLIAVRAGIGGEAGTVAIQWAASDKNFGAEPIDLYYSSSREGPWMPVVRGLKNDGAYRWQVPPGAGGEFYIRLEVSDRAGNTTRCETAQPVVLDLSRPRAKVLGVTASGPQPVHPPVGN